MSTHLTLCHSEEFEVAYVITLKKGSRERRQAWAELLHQGDYNHNFDVLESGRGKVIPKYRSKSNDQNVEHLIVCSYCKALYNKYLLYQHNKTCFMRNKSEHSSKGQPVKEGRLAMPIPKHLSQVFYEKIILRMKKDYIFRLIQNDSLIILFGERAFYSKDLEEHTPNTISCRLRELGRLLQCLRRKSEMKISSITQALHPSIFDTILQCVREIAGFDEEKNSFKKGSVAMRLGYSMKKCASILKSEAIKNDDEELKKVAETFEELFSGDWYDYVSSTASKSIYRAKANKPTLLPSLNDIEKVHILLNDKLSSDDYSVLSRATLCSITLFNRKRGGEVQRLKIEDFDRGLQNGSTTDSSILEGLTEAEKKMIGLFHRIEIRGKFNRTVPILLTETMLNSLKKLKELRSEMCPPITRSYFFCTKTGERPYRGVDVIKDFASEAGVSDLSIFTFTTLRKHVATLTQTFEISKLDQDQLAAFLGHDIRIHRSFYRRPIDIIEKAKVAKILLSVNKGINLPLDMENENEIDEELEEDQEICIEEQIDEDLEQARLDAEIINNEVFASNTDPIQTSKDETSKNSSKHQTSPVTKTKGKKTIWSLSEIEAVKRQLNHCIVTSTLPKKADCMKAIAAESDLKRRSWTNIKHFVYNLIKKNKSKLKC